jgi:hypothetical protein
MEIEATAEVVTRGTQASFHGTTTYAHPGDCIVNVMGGQLAIPHKIACLHGLIEPEEPAPAQAPAPAPDPEVLDWSKLKKSELVKAASERMIDTTGMTKDEIIETLKGLPG